MLKVGTFQVDCTPEGFRVGFGPDAKPATVRDPLLLRGFVLDDGQMRCVVASLDYCGLLNRAYDEMVDGLASAVGAPRDRVAVHCVHQHDAPLLNLEAEALLKYETFPPAWWQEVVGRCAAAAKACTASMREVAEVGHGEVRLFGYASNRRILGPDGTVRAMRFSRCSDESVRDEPTGVIDPMLRTLAFRGDSGALLGSMSFYATHPQVSNGREMWSADAQGEAMRLVTAEAGAGLHAYFSGAFGNVTAGKYSSPTDLEGNLLRFGRLLADGIARNFRGMAWEPAGSLEWVSEAFPFPTEAADRAKLEAMFEADQVPEGQRYVKAAVLSAMKHPSNASYPIRVLKLGSCRVLFLGGEPFVEYQLFAQSLVPDAFLAVAGNCSDSYLYLPMARHFPEGGYEVTSYRWCTEAFEGMFKEAVGRILK